MNQIFSSKGKITATETQLRRISRKAEPTSGGRERESAPGTEIQPAIGREIGRGLEGVGGVADVGGGGGGGGGAAEAALAAAAAHQQKRGCKGREGSPLRQERTSSRTYFASEAILFFWPVVRSVGVVVVVVVDGGGGGGGEESSESVQHVLCRYGKAQDPTQPPAHPRRSQRVPPRSSNLNTFTAHESALGAAVSGSPGYLPVDLSIEYLECPITGVDEKIQNPIPQQKSNPTTKIVEPRPGEDVFGGNTSTSVGMITENRTPLARQRLGRLTFPKFISARGSELDANESLRPTFRRAVFYVNAAGRFLPPLASPRVGRVKMRSIFVAAVSQPPATPPPPPPPPPPPLPPQLRIITLNHVTRG
ncbi:hypothetical protein WN51_12280 [Melipona quadrifasciata]|uniref:Uncharacterized protein n=1 Tax=Melipona quadrifasciata TaxID=166423 RepID=A0A0M9A386_9HYME|nr:hypothetical protein WN51_12280 [Melipona quadrifasciata]